MRALLLLCVLGLAAPAPAHELRHEVEVREATVVTLRYADGTPFAFEAYELAVAGAQSPLQTGRSDALGRIAFVAPEPGRYTLRSWSEDGHGALLSLEAGPGAGAPAPSGADRGLKILAGVGILFGVFGVLALLKRRTT
jgi:nickel transport protein